MPNKNLKMRFGIKINKLIVLLLILVLCLLLIFVVLLVLNQYGLNFSVLGNSKSSIPTNNFLEDRCSYIAGHLIHTINNVNECSLKCRSECYTLGGVYQQVNFTQGNSTCNSCSCLCN